jgi:hypothetical protein
MAGSNFLDDPVLVVDESLTDPDPAVTTSPILSSATSCNPRSSQGVETAHSSQSQAIALLQHRPAKNKSISSVAIE